MTKAVYLKKPKIFKPFAHVNVDDTGIVALRDDPHPCQKKLKKMKM